MNQEVILKLQAYLDGELSEREARDVAALLAQDAEAQKLLAELKTTTTILRGNEPQATLADSREFYWSRIERAIGRTEPETVPMLVAFWFSLRRVIAPVAGLALVLFLGIASLKFNSPSVTDPLAHLAEVESLSEHVSSFSFRSQSENMFVVWLHENSENQTETDREMLEFDDEVLQ